MKKIILKILLITFFSTVAFGAKAEIRDVSWFLKNLRSIDNLPALENSHTAMISTWDTNGLNMDCWTHDNIIGITSER